MRTIKLEIVAIEDTLCTHRRDKPELASFRYEPPIGIIDDKRWEHQEFRLKTMSSYHECMDKYGGDYILPNIINSLDQVARWWYMWNHQVQWRTI